jgi:ABC-type Zn uptake system ZnuABC Zn-binding protein ZnuA
MSEEPGVSRTGAAAVALIAALSLLIAHTACAQDPIAVITTTTDLRSLAEAVGGERIAATSLVPGNVDPEDYQPKPQDLLRLQGASLLVRVGLDYDLWLDGLLARLMRPQIGRGGPAYVDASSGIAVLELTGMSVGPGDGHAHGSGNPHYWLDPRNAEIITASILEGLSRIDPANAKRYEENRAAFLARLQTKLADWERRLAFLRAVPIIAYHNSWPYFARRFRLNVAGFIEIKPGVPAGASHLADLVRTMRARQVRIILREPHDPQRDIAFIADQTGARIMTLAASVGALPQARDYIALFDTDVETLETAAPIQ